MKRVQQESETHLFTHSEVPELNKVSIYLSWYCLWDCCKLPLLCPGMFLVSQIPQLLPWRGRCILSKAFSVSNEMIKCFFFQFVYMVDCIIGFQILNHLCISGMKPTWSWWMIFFAVFLLLVCKCFIEYFSFIFIWEIDL